MKKINILVLTLAFVSTFLTSCVKEEIIEKPVFTREDFDPNKGALNLNFKHTFNGQDFAVNKNFTDTKGNTYSFHEIRYWVSNIEMIKPNGEAIKIPNSYYLVENRDTFFFHGTTAANSNLMSMPPKIRQEVLVGNVPVGEYTKIRFGIGVDPTYNDNFALSAGELNINQMAQVAGWAWKTSYIFLRTKGVFVKSGGNPLNDAIRFVAENGGNDQYRTVTLDLPQAVNVKAGQLNSFELRTELTNLFENLNIPNVSGKKPTGWTADPNLTKYDKFINASSPDEMTILSNNSVKQFQNVASK